MGRTWKRARGCVCIIQMYIHTYMCTYNITYISCANVFICTIRIYTHQAAVRKINKSCVCAVQSQILVPHPLTSAGSYLHPKFPLGWTNIDVENTLVSLRKWPINVASPHLFLQFSLQGVCVCFNLGLLWMADPKNKKNMCHCSSRNQWVCLQSEKIQELWSWKSLTLQ